MAEFDVNTLKLTAVVYGEDDRVFPSEVPFVLAAACVLCATPSLERPCDVCHATYCASCLPCPNCVMTPSPTVSDEVTPSEIDTGSSASTHDEEQLVAASATSLYDELCRGGTRTIRLPQGYLMRKHIPLGSCYIDDEP